MTMPTIEFVRAKDTGTGTRIAYANCDRYVDGYAGGCSANPRGCRR